MRDWILGMSASQAHFFGADMDGPIMAADLAALAPALDAPDKAFVIVPDAGHFAVMSQPEALAAALREHVRPHAPGGG